MPYFRDVNFFSPKNKSEVVDAEAIRQELAMLFNTKPFERLFEPEYGIALENYLFDLINQESADELYAEITYKVKRFLSSVTIDMGKTSVIPDPDNNRYVLNIYFNIKGAGADGSYQMTKAFSQP